MTNFIYDNTSPGTTKVDLTPLPAGTSPANYVRAADVNVWLAALTDIQTFCRGANWFGFSTQASDPAPAGIPAYIWYKTDGTLNLGGIAAYSLANAARTISAGTGLTGGGDLTANRTLSIANTTVTPGTYNFTTLTVNAQGQLTAASSATAVTSVSAGTGLSGGTITSTGTISIANTAVTPGSYTLANITVNAQGQLTAASSGTISGKLLNVQQFTNGTFTYTPTSGTNSVLIEMVGGGGGGGGTTGGSSASAGGAGGSSGTYLKIWITGGGAITSPTNGVTAGALGTGGAAGAAGGNGSSSTITINGTQYVASGGSGGSGMTSGTSLSLTSPSAPLGGSTGLTTDVVLVSSYGAGGIGLRLSGGVAAAGSGGSSPLGAGGVTTAVGNGVSAVGWGGGGGGGLSTASNATGGAGGAGTVIVYEFS